MWLYSFIFLIPTFVYFYTYKNKQQSKTFLYWFIFFLMIFVGISDMLGGYDRYIYGQVFDVTADDLRSNVSILSTASFRKYQKEIGYDFLNVLVGFFTKNRYIFILTVTSIIYSLILISFKKYMSNYPLAMIIFMAFFFFYTFTYLRQVLAVTIAWYSIRYVIDRKFWKFMVVIIIAFLFHYSAIIFFPFYFLPIRKFKMTNVIIVMFLCFLIGMSGLTNTLFEIFGTAVGDEERTIAYASDSQTSFRPTYFIQAFFFLMCIFSTYHKIPTTKLRLVLLNMALAFNAILLFFIMSLNGGRLSWFFMLGNISTITYILTCERKLKLLSVSMVFVCFFCYLLVYTNWQYTYSLYPYKTFFTDGMRDVDPIRDIYEYDPNYAIDKFYR